MKNIYEGVGERIRHVRTKRGYTREFLAEKAEISSKFLYEIETGKKGFSVLVLYNLCQALGIDSNYILSGKQEQIRDRDIGLVLELFSEDKTERITNILKEIYKLIG